MERHILNQFKNKFLKMKEELMSDELAGETALGGDEVEMAGTERERLLEMKLIGRRAFLLRKVDNSLSRIEEGTYGECCECGDEISLARLEARPTADYCIVCKEEAEREENQRLYARRSHTHGKELIGEGNVLAFERDEPLIANAKKMEPQFNLGATLP